jgi:hypothetical protein
VFDLLIIALTLALVYAGYAAARRFVRERLRYVDAVQKPAAPLLAGGAALLLAAVITAVLPFVGLGTAISFGIAIGTGVAAGARDVKRGYWLVDGT